MYADPGTRDRIGSNTMPRSLDREACAAPAATWTSTQSYETGKPEVALEITRERAADLGVLGRRRSARTISALFAGFEAATFEDRGERYDVRVQVRPEYRDDLDRARPGPGSRPGSGALVPLRNLVVPTDRKRPRPDRPRESHAGPSPIYGNLDGKSAADADAEISGSGRTPSSHRGRVLPASPSVPPSACGRPRPPSAFAFLLALDRHLYDPRRPVQLLPPPLHDHALGTALLRGRLRGGQARRPGARRDGPDRLPDADGHRDEERHPAGGLHQYAARARAPAARGRPPGGALRGCAPC